MANICITTSEKSKKEQIINKIHAHLFFDSQGIVHTEFVPQGHTINQFYYREILERLRKELFACDQALVTIGCSITTTPLVTRRSL